jgi:hypothetical protein
VIRRSNSGSIWREGNVIRLKGHWVHKIRGKTADVLTRDERSGETDNQVVAAICPYAEWRGRGEMKIMIDANECR